MTDDEARQVFAKAAVDHYNPRTPVTTIVTAMYRQSELLKTLERMEAKPEIPAKPKLTLIDRRTRKWLRKVYDLGR